MTQLRKGTNPNSHHRFNRDVDLQSATILYEGDAAEASEGVDTTAVLRLVSHRVFDLSLGLPQPQDGGLVSARKDYRVDIGCRHNRC